MIDHATLPLSWYFDPAVLEAERRSVLARGPDFLGAAGLAPEHGAYHVLDRRDGGEMVVRDGDRLRLVSNVCLHRGAKMLQGRGRAKSLVCPLHLWSYDFSGRLRSAPHFPEPPCDGLASRELRSWKGMLFAGELDPEAEGSALADRDDLDVARYVYHRTEAEEQPVNWKLHVETFLDNYHVGVIHPGLRKYLDVPTVVAGRGALYGERFAYQEIPPLEGFARVGSPAFEAWQAAILRVAGGRVPPFASQWLFLYPNVMLEWYPYTFAASTFHPRSPEATLVVSDFYHDPRALEVVPEFPELELACLTEVQQEDDLAIVALHEGRRLAYERDPRGYGGCATYQSPMEDALGTYHRLLLREVGAELAVAGEAYASA